MTTQGSHCILKLEVHLVIFLIFVPSMYSVYRGPHHFWGYKPNFGGKKPSAEGKWERCNLCPMQDSGSLAVFKVTARDQDH